MIRLWPALLCRFCAVAHAQFRIRRPALFRRAYSTLLRLIAKPPPPRLARWHARDMDKSALPSMAKKSCRDCMAPVVASARFCLAARPPPSHVSLDHRRVPFGPPCPRPLLQPCECQTLFCRPGALLCNNAIAAFYRWRVSSHSRYMRTSVVHACTTAPPPPPRDNAANLGKLEKKEKSMQDGLLQISDPSSHMWTISTAAEARSAVGLCRFPEGPPPPTHTRSREDALQPQLLLWRLY